MNNAPPTSPTALGVNRIVKSIALFAGIVDGHAVRSSNGAPTGVQPSTERSVAARLRNVIVRSMGAESILRVPNSSRPSDGVASSTVTENVGGNTSAENLAVSPWPVSNATRTNPTRDPSVVPLNVTKPCASSPGASVVPTRPLTVKSARSAVADVIVRAVGNELRTVIG